MLTARPTSILITFCRKIFIQYVIARDQYFIEMILDCLRSELQNDLIKNVAESSKVWIKEAFGNECIDA